MKRFFDKLYIKENSTPFDTVALSELNSVAWKSFEIRAKSKVESDADGDHDMGDGTKKIDGEKTAFEAPMDLSAADYTTLRTFINKKVTAVLVDTENPDASGDYQACPAVFGVRLYPKKSIESGGDAVVTLTGGKSIGAGNLAVIQRDITVTN